MSLTEGPIITLRASLCGRTSLLRRLVSPSAGDWYFQHFEIKGTEDGNVEEEAVVDFREHMDGLAAEELEVDLILGGDEGMECTYSQGYKNWQAVFTCRTCTPDGNAGFCTACSLSCLEGHDVLELWTWW